MMGVYLLGWYHAVNTPLPYSQWTSEKKGRRRRKKRKEKKNKAKQKRTFKSCRLSQFSRGWV